MAVTPQVAIILLTYNGLVDTLECLESLQGLDYQDHEVIVVDNGSADGTPDVVQATYPDITVIENGENLGYAEGNNVGIRLALEREADYMLLLNNDTVVAPDCLSSLVAAAQADPAVGFAGPLVYFHDRPNAVWSAGGRIDWLRGRAIQLGMGEEDSGRYRTAREVDYLPGCALLVRRHVIERAGLLDARFFMYFEDVEWCARAARVGYRIIHVPSARIWHKISPTQQSISPPIIYYMTRNRLLLLHCIGAGPTAWLCTLVGDTLRTAMSWSVRPKWRGKQRQRNALIRAIRDFISGAWGRQELDLLGGDHP